MKPKLYIHSIKLFFDPRDLWIGLHWDKSVLPSRTFGVYVLYFCIIPMLPIRIKVVKRRKKTAISDVERNREMFKLAGQFERERFHLTLEPEEEQNDVPEL